MARLPIDVGMGSLLRPATPASIPDNYINLPITTGGLPGYMQTPQSPGMTAGDLYIVSSALRGPDNSTGELYSDSSLMRDAAAIKSCTALLVRRAVFGVTSATARISSPNAPRPWEFFKLSRPRITGVVGTHYVAHVLEALRKLATYNSIPVEDRELTDDVIRLLSGGVVTRSYPDPGWAC